MANASRQKGLAGEREVRSIFEAQGFEVRGLEGTGDYLMLGPDSLTLHMECKRQETARPWLWIAQAEADAPRGTVPVVAFRRNYSKWYAMLSADLLAYLLGDKVEKVT